MGVARWRKFLRLTPKNEGKLYMWEGAKLDQRDGYAVHAFQDQLDKVGGGVLR